MKFPIFGKITNVPNHQPEIEIFSDDGCFEETGSNLALLSNMAQMETWKGMEEYQQASVTDFFTCFFDGE